jgi:uncharacterized protein YciW
MQTTRTATTGHTTTAQLQAAARGPAKLKYTHEAMVDLIVAEPTVSTAELAELFGYTQAWVARVIASDSFQARLASRKGELVDPHLAQHLNERLRGVALHAVELVGQKLDAEESASYALDALGLATKAMGLHRHAK